MAAAAPAFKSAFKAKRRKGKKGQHQQHPTPFIKKGKAFLRAPSRFQLMPHWSELCPMPLLAASEFGKVSLYVTSKRMMPHPSPYSHPRWHRTPGPLPNNLRFFPEELLHPVALIMPQARRAHPMSQDSPEQEAG